MKRISIYLLMLASVSNASATKNNLYNNIAYSTNTGIQYDSNPKPVWVNMDIGASSLGLAANAGVNLMIKNKFVFGLNAMTTSSISFSTLFQTKDWTEFTTYNATAGKAFLQPPNLLINVSAGISYTEVKYHTVKPEGGGWFAPAFDIKKVNCIGFPVNAKLCIPIKTAVGLNLDIGTNINKEKTMFMIMAGVRIGRILKK